MVPSMTYKEHTSHLPWIDALRFIAAFLVLFTHCRHDFFLRYDQLDPSQQDPITFLFYTIGRLDPEAVIVFFVISGFLVGGIGLERIKNGTFRLLDYAVNRTVRIGLPLLGATVIFGVVTFFTEAQWSWAVAAGNLFSLQGIFVDPLVPPFWSLSYEVWFYILLFAIGLTFTRHRGWGLVLFVVCCLVFAVLNPLYLLCWLMGAVAWLSRPRRSNKLVLLGSMIGVTVCLMLSQMTMGSEALPMDITLSHDVVTVLLCFAFCVLVQQAVLLPPPFKPGCLNLAWRVERAFSHLADFSYTLYLAHRIVMLVVFQYIFTKYEGTVSGVDLARFSALLIGVILVCYLIYLLSERHTARVRRWVKVALGIACRQ